MLSARPCHSVMAWVIRQTGRGTDRGRSLCCCAGLPGHDLGVPRASLDQAQSYVKRAVAEARRLERAYTLVFALAAEENYHRGAERGVAAECKDFRLRAAAGLARLWRDQGKRAEAHDLLAPVHGWFTEGFDAKCHVAPVGVWRLRGAIVSRLKL